MNLFLRQHLLPRADEEEPFFGSISAPRDKSSNNNSSSQQTSSPRPPCMAITDSADSISSCSYRKKQKENTRNHYTFGVAVVLLVVFVGAFSGGAFADGGGVFSIIVPGHLVQQKPLVEDIHIAILSDRILELSVCIGTLCSSFDDENGTFSLFFHIVNNEPAFLRDHGSSLIEHCPKNTKFEIISADDTIKVLSEDNDFELPWLNIPPGMDGKWGVETPYTNDKHSSPMNLLRFYLPFFPSLQSVDRLIFMDDDLVITKDIKHLWNLNFQPEKTFLTGCQHWAWKGPNKYTSSIDMTVKETGYIGAHSTICDEGKVSSEVSCTRSDLESDLNHASLIISPDSPFAAHPLERRAFNQGFNMIDTREWKEQKITRKFENWVTASYTMKLFRPNALAFGLGLSYFAVGDSFQCYDDNDITHLVGK
mmetsp:Transcript_12545/g.18770  ORF Transcript_12545/g.18770 Transcript_12545/m.18770 type:complete len:423 (-) Transcript_12545:234-1502(-)